MYEITVFYVDVFLFTHFFFEYIILRMIQKLMAVRGGTFRSFLGAMFAGGCNVLLYFISLAPPVQYVLTYFVIVFFELRIAFPALHMGTYIKAMGMMYLLSFGVGGFLKWIYEHSAWAAIYGKSIIWLAGAIYFITLCMAKLGRIVKKDKQARRNLRSVTCEINGREICCTGLLDTGNSLYDPISKKPVLVLEKGELEKNSIYIKEEQYRVIPYHSLGTKQGVLEAFVADKVQISKLTQTENKDTIKREKVIVGVYEGKLSHSGMYQMILHPEM